MVYEGPQQRPKAQDWYRQQSAPPHREVNPPQKSSPQSIPQSRVPQYEQLSLLNLDTPQFRRPPSMQREGALAGRAPQPQNFAQQSLARRQQEQTVAAERYQYKQLDWFEHNNFGFNKIDPSLLPVRPEDQFAAHQQEQRDKAAFLNLGLTPLQQIRQERSKPAKELDLSGLKAISAYIEAHPEYKLMRGANLEVLQAKANAYQAQLAQANAKRIAETQSVPQLEERSKTQTDGKTQTQPLAAMVSGPAVMAAMNWGGPNILPINAQSSLIGTSSARIKPTTHMLFPAGVQKGTLIADALALPAASAWSAGAASGLPSWIPGAARFLTTPLAPVLAGAAALIGGPLALPGGDKKETDMFFQRQRFLQQQQAGNIPAPAPRPTQKPTSPSSPIAPPVHHPYAQSQSAPPQTVAPIQPYNPATDPQQVKFDNQQKALSQLWKLQGQLNKDTDGFSGNNSDHLKKFVAQLTPQEKQALQQAVTSGYNSLLNIAKQADYSIDAHQRGALRQQIEQQVLYRKYIPAREISHFGSQFFDAKGYTPKRMQQVRGYFDQVFAGKYSKSIPAASQAKILQAADAQYRQETGKTQVDRNSLLWKTYRNANATESFPDLWYQFTDDLRKAEQGPMQTVVHNDDPRLRSNAATQMPSPRPLNVPNHTGHSVSQNFDPNKGQLSPTPTLNVPSHTGHTDTVKPAVTHVFQYTTDYRKNYEQAYGSIPAGSQIHHLAPRAVFRDSQLAQAWAQRGITKLDYPENLLALPKTKDAYDKSSIKIQHSGSHSNWNAHATDVLNQKQRQLIKRYGSLDKVPETVMKQAKDDVMQTLREDIQDKDLGIEEGWITPGREGMDRVSQVQVSAQIG